MMERATPTSGDNPKVGIIRHLNVFTAFALGAFTAIVVWRLGLSFLPADSESAPLFTRDKKETACKHGNAGQAHNHSQGPSMRTFKKTHAACPSRVFPNRSKLMLKITATPMASTMFNFKGK